MCECESVCLTDAVGEVEIELVRERRLLSLFAQHPLLPPRLLGLIQSLWSDGRGIEKNLIRFLI